ncbi:MAG: N-acetyltransferase [Planctomycetota bacterium]|nr:MAG: N-acetyltransferase [Planctomycetota bacterium]
MIHPTAEVQTSHVGEGTFIWQHCVVLAGARIGENCNINCHVFIENDVVVGDNVTIKPGVQLWDGMRIEDNVFIGPNVTFTNDLRPRSKQYSEQFLTTTIRTGASIGANATIVAGITIGRYAMIGAGSVVTKDVPDFGLWYGNPAVFKAYVCRCGRKLDAGMNCFNCGMQYDNEQGKVIRHD